MRTLAVLLVLAAVLGMAGCKSSSKVTYGGTTFNGVQVGGEYEPPPTREQVEFQYDYNAGQAAGVYSR